MLNVMTWDRRCRRCKRLTAAEPARDGEQIAVRCVACGQVHRRVAAEDLVEELDAWIEAGGYPDRSTAWFARCAWACKLIQPTPRAMAATEEERSD